MTSENVLKELLGEALRRENDRYALAPEHKFSLRHKIAMRRTLATYERNCRKSCGNRPAAPFAELSARRRLIFAAIVVVLAAFLAGCVWFCTSLYRTDRTAPEGYAVNKAALAKVRERLLSEGEDADSRTPTHEITAEQAEWLAGRYDLDFLSACSFTHEEYGRFMLDLAYLNVFSLDEVESMYGVMPFNANHGGYLYKTGGAEGCVDPFDGSGALLSEDELQTGLAVEYLKAKYGGLTEAEYEARARELLAKRRECLGVIEEFFGRARAGSGEASDKPTVERIAY